MKGGFRKWFEGPGFLYKGDSVEYFDVNRRIRDCDVLLQSSKTCGKIKNDPHVLSIVTEVNNEASNNYILSKQSVNISYVMDITRFSSFERLLDTTAYVLRFIRNIKARIEDQKPLLDECPIAEELEHAIARWIIVEHPVIHKSKGYEK